MGDFQNPRILKTRGLAQVQVSGSPTGLEEPYEVRSPRLLLPRTVEITRLGGDIPLMATYTPTQWWSTTTTLFQGTP
jgi:hypothetical protein